MSVSPKTVRPVAVPTSAEHPDGLLRPLAAYLDALEARVAALERRSSAVPLMTAADAARYAQVNVETILRASGPASCRWPAMSAARPGSLVMPSTAGLPSAHRRRRFPLRPAGVPVRGQARRLRQRGGPWAECRRQLAHGLLADPGAIRQRDRRARRSVSTKGADALAPRNQERFSAHR
jgi:hypothetical protein